VSSNNQIMDGMRTMKSILKSSMRRLYFSRSPNLDVRLTIRSITPVDAHFLRTTTILARRLRRVSWLIINIRSRIVLRTCCNRSVFPLCPSTVPYSTNS
jgi:hypothetical protein